MHGMSYTGCNYLGVNHILVKMLMISLSRYSRHCRYHQPADKRAYKGAPARAASKAWLAEKNQGSIGLDALLLEEADGP
jgi:hypothetical protein